MEKLMLSFEQGAAHGDAFGARMLDVCRRWVGCLSSGEAAPRVAEELLEYMREHHDDESTPGYEVFHDVERWLERWTR